MRLKKFSEYSETARVSVLSAAVGLCAGAAAVVLIKAIGLLHGSLGTLDAWARYLLLPGVGMLLSYVVIRYLVRDNVSHGVTKVLLAVSRNDSRIKPHNMWSSMLTSALTIGFGGSVGAEAPIVYTGAALGSNIGRKAGLSHRSITILVGCGAAGAIAGIFKAPLAGVLFTLEVLLFNISLSSMMPLLISTVTATVVAYVFTGDYNLFLCQVAPFSLQRMPFYLILGLFCGLCSVYFLRTTLALEDRISRRIPEGPLRWIICAAALGGLIMLFPPLYGEGYDALGSLLQGDVVTSEISSPLQGLLSSGWGIPVFFLLVMLAKVFSMTLTNAGGGVGGTFGPTLFVGGVAGFALVRSLNMGFPALALPEQNFVLVGMAGLMAGVMQAPMTAIFLIAEITGGYDLLLPLIFCSAVSFGTTRIWERYSIYTKRIAASGDLLTHDSDQAVMTLLNTADLVRDKYPRIRKDASLRRLVALIKESTAAVIAVTDRDDRLEGIVDVGEIRGLLFDTKNYDSRKVKDVMSAPPASVYSGEKMDSVMEKFDLTNAWRLPVVDRDTGRYLGFISKSRILMAYREQLREISSE